MGVLFSAMIHLKEVDRKNWIACAGLELQSEQEKFLASNVYTIAQRQFEGFIQQYGDLCAGVRQASGGL